MNLKFIYFFFNNIYYLTKITDFCVYFNFKELIIKIIKNMKH